MNYALIFDNNQYQFVKLIATEKKTQRSAIIWANQRQKN